MRVNIYSQELTKEVSLERKVSENGIEHWGIRFWMHSTDKLHQTPDDDDRSAVTFWLPNAKSFTSADLAEVFESAADLIRQVT